MDFGPQDGPKGKKGGTTREASKNVVFGATAGKEAASDRRGTPVKKIMQLAVDGLRTRPMQPQKALQQ